MRKILDIPNHKNGLNSSVISGLSRHGVSGAGDDCGELSHSTLMLLNYLQLVFNPLIYGFMNHGKGLIFTSNTAGYRVWYSSMTNYH